MRISTHFLLLSLAIAAMVGGLHGCAHASDAKVLQSLLRLETLNEKDPEQNRSFIGMGDIIGRRILDNTNRVLGDVRDITLDRNGGIVNLQADLDRLNLGAGTMPINFDRFGVRLSNNAYKLNFNDDQIAGLVPEILATIPTAAGENTDTFSLKKIRGKKVYAFDGRYIGKVRNVMFNASGTRAEMLYIDIGYKSLNGKKLGIPFAGNTYESNSIKVRDDMADAALAYFE